MTYTPRPHQQKVLDYRGGYMGVSAVPGSGKTATLSALAARLVLQLTDEELAREATGSEAPGGDEARREEPEVLIVTFANTTVEKFRAEVGKNLKAQGFLPGIGYRVRTLHSLALDILRERPELVKLDDKFRVIDERAAGLLRTQAVSAWLAANPNAYLPYLSPEVQAKTLDKVIKWDWPELVQDTAAAFVKCAKDRRYAPEKLKRNLDAGSADLPLARMGAAVYRDYQLGLERQGKVDFDDMVRLALDALEAAPDYLKRLRERWPFILEDEAQDSSQLQEDLLRLLAGEGGNWVRVGDPNQAIYETFTNANPRFLVDFIRKPPTVSRELPTSGRSARGIMDLANYLVDWSRVSHPLPAGRQALMLPHIQPTAPGDPQVNPPDGRTTVYLHQPGFRADREMEEEAQKIADHLARWLPEHATWTVAVLVPRNTRGVAIVDALRARGIPHIELLQSTAATRNAADVLQKVLAALSQPESSKALADAYLATRQPEPAAEEERARTEAQTQRIRACPRVEEYLWPALERDWLQTLPLGEEPAAGAARLELAEFCDMVRRWQGAVLLPIDQLVLTLAQDLFKKPAEIALAHKIAVLLAQKADQPENAEWGLRQFMEALKEIAANERRFIGLAEDETGFDTEKHPGEVVVATLHRAKGMEWDRVYLVSANNYDFPSGAENDSYIAEKWFVRDHLNLLEEALAQLDALMLPDTEYEEGKASRLARESYVAERLRLLYVGITRARRELFVTWNTGHLRKQEPALAFRVLSDFWKARTGA